LSCRLKQDFLTFCNREASCVFLKWFTDEQKFIFLRLLARIKERRYSEIGNQVINNSKCNISPEPSHLPIRFRPLIQNLLPEADFVESEHTITKPGKSSFEWNFPRSWEM